MAAALAVTAATGCGGRAAGGATSTPAAAAPPTAAPTPGPGAARLKALALTAGEQAGPYTADEPVLDEPMSELYEATPPVCTPLSTLGGAGHTAQAYAVAQVPGEWQAVGTDILLRSYAGGGAAAALKSLAEAGRQCAGGYTEDRALASAKVLRVESVPAPALGDEALAFRIVVRDVKDADVSLFKYLTVIRAGQVTLSFRSDVIDTKDFGGVPREVVEAQWAKFSRGGGGAAG